MCNAFFCYSLPLLSFAKMFYSSIFQNKNYSEDNSEKYVLEIRIVAMLF